jgi:hypothetical protein
LERIRKENNTRMCGMTAMSLVDDVARGCGANANSVQLRRLHLTEKKYLSSVP